jgi:hypothetical protein
MKKKRFFYGILSLLLALTLILCGCPNPADATPKGQEQSETPEQPETPDPVDPAFWFGEIHAALIDRIGTVTSEEYTGDMGQIANSQYVCDAINAKWQTSYTPVSGTATQAANVEYLLKMIDKANANRGATSYGTSAYATLQALDKAVVDDAVQRLWKPAGKFVAVASNSDKAAYSTDGINWTETMLPKITAWSCVAFGNNKFVAINNYNNDKEVYSTDSITWTMAASSSGVQWTKLIYGNDKFIAVGGISNSSSTFTYSTDGSVWTSVSVPSAQWYGVVYGNGKYIASSFNVSVVSTDGINWAEITVPIAGVMAYGNGRFVVVDRDIDGAGNRIAYSTDGITWIMKTLPVSAYWGSITYGNNKFVAVSKSYLSGSSYVADNKVVFSTDGITWTAATLPNSADWRDITYGNGKFVAVAFSTDKAAYSADGITWAAATMPSSANWLSVTYGGE